VQKIFEQIEYRMRKTPEIETGIKLPKSSLWMTSSTIITILLLYLVINGKEYFNTFPPLLISFGAPTAVKIYDGHFWGILTANFIHINWKPLVLNLVEISIFGYLIERRIGLLRFSLLLLIAAVVPSLWQLTLTDDTGIGFSGINFCLFGYLLIKGNTDPAFSLKGKTMMTVFMLAEILFCNYYNLTIDDIFRTEAMAVGLLLGLLLGVMSSLKKKNKTAFLSFLLLLSVCTLVYAPWSAQWQLFKGVQYHESNQIEKAKWHYHRALHLNPNNEAAKKNLNLIAVDHLMSLAYDAHEANNFQKAKQLYEKILVLDPSNAWAKGNIRKLP
jgi:membrane associated rhomboid family serine protease